MSNAALELAIVQDLLEERGWSWLAQIAGRRDVVFGYLAGLEDKYARIWRCSSCDQPHVGDTHLASCTHALLLRIIGGDEETQRQVEAAHEAAVALPT